MGMFGWKYFWLGSKPSYTRTHPPGHLPLIMSILYECGLDSHQSAASLPLPLLTMVNELEVAQTTQNLEDFIITCPLPTDETTLACDG